MPKNRILLVEDEAEVAALAERSLQSLGYTVISRASSGEVGVTDAQRYKPDLVLMDIGLAGSMDGIEAARRIHDSLDIPAVFLTGIADEQTLVRAKDAEPFGYIVKPFTTRELRTTIEIALHQHQAGRNRTSKAIRETEQELLTAFQNAVADIFRSGLDGESLNANPALLRILGCESCEAFVAKVKHVDNGLRLKPNSDHGSERQAKNGNPADSFKLQAYRRDGSTIWISGNVKVIEDGSGKPKSYEGGIINITDSKSPVGGTRRSE